MIGMGSHRNGVTGMGMGSVGMGSGNGVREWVTGNGVSHYYLLSAFLPSLMSAQG